MLNKLTGNDFLEPFVLAAYFPLKPKQFIINAFHTTLLVLYAFYHILQYTIKMSWALINTL